jgi:hypothetical protein
MDFDLEHDVMNTATELFALAGQETATKAQYDQAVEDVIDEVLRRHPEFSSELFAFAMGRALGRCEGQLMEQRRQKRR